MIILVKFIFYVMLFRAKHSELKLKLCKENMSTAPYV